jgi:hypothetical protein
MRTDPKPNLWKGFLAGALGGLAASFAMSQFHALFQKAGSAALQRGGLTGRRVRTNRSVSL